jgi:hypothetical protein
MEFYVWMKAYIGYVAIVVTYSVFSIGMLILSKKYEWIYEGMLKSMAYVASSLKDVIKAETWENDPGLVVVLITIGPILYLINLAWVFASAIVMLADKIISGLFIRLTVILPRWAINYAVKTKNKS